MLYPNMCYNKVVIKGQHCISKDNLITLKIQILKCTLSLLNVNNFKFKWSGFFR